ncbi:MAG TPA: RNA methyltransferase [Candidatus Saccharimonadales bacterium]|nr:RNA methyltransferase [Candidatus Saccharimonadales bacterium]
MVITSKQNPKIKSVAKLRQRREREKTGLTLIDGYEELAVATASGVAIETLYHCPELMGGEDQRRRLMALVSGGMEAYELTRDVFEKIAYREGPDGWLAVVKAPKTDLTSLSLRERPLLLICETVEKPGNLGAMLRTADAAGADAVISVTGVTDWGNPNIIRASKGAVFTVPVANATLDEALAWLKARNIAVIASTPDTTTIYTDTAMREGVALTVGSEKYGHTSEWLQAAQVKVRIPMVGQVNSLNVATSAALLLYEAVRQRNQ